MTVIMPDDLYERLRVEQGIEIAQQRRDIGLSEIINDLLRKHFDNHDV